MLIFKVILYIKAKSTATFDEKTAETLKKAFGLYQGRLFELGELDMGSWLLPYITHKSYVLSHEKEINKDLITYWHIGAQNRQNSVIHYEEYSGRRECFEPGRSI